MLLKPWYDVIKPRKEFGEHMIPEVMEFVVHLDKVRDGMEIEEYTQPALFFARTYLTSGLMNFATEVIRQLSGEKLETHAVFHLAARAGGGKTHALTALYHLVMHGAEAHPWTGISPILAKAGVTAIPKAKTAMFIGTEFDMQKGRGGKRGEPLRKTPWGEIAFQLGGKEAFAKIAEYDETLRAPDAEIVHDMLSQHQPCLILFDDLLTYLARYRTPEMAEQVCLFLKILSQQVRTLNRTALVMTSPFSESLPESPENQLLASCRQVIESISKPVVISTDRDHAEMIRRRLFHWNAEMLSQDGSLLLPREALETCTTYAAWTRTYRSQLPPWFAFDQAEIVFLETYPFHPGVLSVFERKWKTLPSFQHIRGLLRMLALWLANEYQEGYSKTYSDPLIGLGTAPLDDPDFRAAVREQLGDDRRLDSPIMADIGGRNAFAPRLDNDSVDDTIKHNRLHVKAATTIFFESKGGMSEGGISDASEPEIRLAVGEPDINNHDIETVLNTLINRCYFLVRDDKRYRFSLSPNLNKLFADHTPGIHTRHINERVKHEIEAVFANSELMVLFPKTSSDIPDRPMLTLVVLFPECGRHNPQTLSLIESCTASCGQAARIFKSALVWVIPDDHARLSEEVRTLLTWEDIQEELSANSTLLPNQSVVEQLRIAAQVAGNIKASQKNLQEMVWQIYKYLALLNAESHIEFIDMGKPHPSLASSLLVLIVNQLRLFDYIADSVSPRFLTRNYPASLKNKEWTTKAVWEMFFTSPLFPRLLNQEIIKETIAKGASNGVLAYVGPKHGEKYEPFLYRKNLAVADVELSDERYILTPEAVEEYLSQVQRTLTTLTIDQPHVNITAGEKMTFTVRAWDEDGEEMKHNVSWEATGGTIDQNGVFTAGEKDGSNFEVRAHAGKKTAWVKVTILSKKAEAAGPIELPRFENPPPPPAPTHASWSGDISGDIWNPFYQRVLSRFAAEYAVTINVRIDCAKESGIVQEDIDALKASLRELGLPGDIQER